MSREQTRLAGLVDILSGPKPRSHTTGSSLARSWPSCVGTYPLFVQVAAPLARRRRIQPPRGRGILAESILARSGTIPCLSAVPVSSLHQSHIAWSRRGPTRSGDMHRVVNAPCQAGQETVRAVMNRIPCLLTEYIAKSVPEILQTLYFQCLKKNWLVPIWPMTLTGGEKAPATRGFRLQLATLYRRQDKII